MDQVKLFREYTRQLYRNLENMDRSDCCQCNVNTLQCYIVVEIGRAPGRYKQSHRGACSKRLCYQRAF